MIEGKTNWAHVAHQAADSMFIQKNAQIIHPIGRFLTGYQNLIEAAPVTCFHSLISRNVAFKMN